MDITFFAWADTHYGYSPDEAAEDFRGDIVEQLHRLPGRAYPDWVGGTVERPRFVVHLGDMVDGGPDADAEFRAFEDAMQSMRLPRYEILGNHDAADPITQYVTQRYGGSSYHFSSDGIGFIALHIDYDDQGTEFLHDEQLAWLGDVVGEMMHAAPIVLFTHVQIARLSNVESLLKVLRPYNVILNVGGHVHKPSVVRHVGFPCLTVGHCRDHPIDPRFGRSFHVIRITDERLLALSWRWDERDWERGRGWTDPRVATRQVTLDEPMPVRGRPPGSSASTTGRPA